MNDYRHIADEMGEGFYEVLDRLVAAGVNADTLAMLILYSTNTEFLEGPRYPDGSAIYESLERDGVAGHERLAEFLFEEISSSAPRDIFSKVEGRVSDIDREAILLRNVVCGRFLDPYYLARLRAVSRFSQESLSERLGHPDTRVSNVVIILRRILSGGKLSDEARRYLTLGLLDHESPTVSDLAGSYLKNITPDDMTLSRLRGLVGKVDRKAATRVLSWLAPHVEAILAARVIVRNFLGSVFPEVRKKAAKTLVPSISDDDMIPEFVALAFDNEVGIVDEIRAVVPPDIITRQKTIHLLPQLESGLLSPAQARSLADGIGYDPSVTAAFTRLTVKVDHEWETLESPSTDLGYLFSILCTRTGKLPKVIWDTLVRCTERGLDESYEFEGAAACLAEAQAGHEGARRVMAALMKAQRHSSSFFAAAISIASKDAVFARTLLSLASQKALGEYETRRLIRYIAHNLTDDASQKVVADYIAERWKGYSYPGEIEELVYSLREVDWSPAIISLVEGLAKDSDIHSRIAMQAIASRIPGTARALPGNSKERSKAIDASIKGHLENTSAFRLVTSLRNGLLESYEDFFEGWGGYGERSEEPKPMSPSEYPDGRSPLNLLFDYKVDPHETFWSKMPTDLHGIAIDFEPIMSRRGGETVTLMFAKGQSMSLSMSELLTPAEEPEDEQPRYSTKRRNRIDERQAFYENPYSSKMSVRRLLRIVRANIGLVCVPALPAEHLPASCLIMRRKKIAVVERERSPNEVGHTHPPSLNAYHPYRFVDLYRSTSFADAFDENLTAVIKQSPAERVIPKLKLGSAAEAVLSGMIRLESLIYQWMSAGNIVVDLPNLPDTNTKVHLAAPEKADTTYVSLRNQKSVEDAIDGFYLSVADQRAGKNAGYYVIFTRRDEDKHQTLVQRTQDMLPIAVAFLRGGSDFNPGDVKIGRLAPSADDIDFEEALAAAARCIGFIQQGTMRAVGAVGKGSIDVLFGRGHSPYVNGGWLSSGCPIVTYRPTTSGEEEKRRAVAEAEEDTRKNNGVIVLAPRPPSADGSTTHYLVEETDGSWKRIRKGDFRQSYGLVKYPQFASKSVRLAIVTVYLKGKKPLQIGDVQPSLLEFGKDGAFDEALRATMFDKYGSIWETKRRRVTTPWTPSDKDLTAIRDNVFRGQTATLLSPRYEGEPNQTDLRKVR